jgi:MYXO-CTERM domain-containing protein
MSWLAMSALGVGTALAGVKLPVESCTTSADCVGCGLCVSGVCSFESRAPVCRCDAECRQYGEGACALLRPDQPRCGGQCARAASTTLECGVAQDGWTIEPAAAPSPSPENHASISDAKLITVSSEWNPKYEPPDDGCSVSAVRPVSYAPWLFLLGALALRRRR